jgi:sulfonate transport system substrate-binding protein
MNLSRRRLLAAAIAAPAIPAPAIPAALTHAARAAEPRSIRIGIQKGEPVVMAARANKDFETALAGKGIGVEWTEFQFGPPMLEAMRVGGIDVGAVGDTPPLFAQAARADLRYIAANRGAPQSILLPAGSKIQTLADLKGKKLAFGRGSSAHNFTLMALEKAGLRYDEIQPIYLGPADAGPAFERGAIDAWTIWEPYAALFAIRPGVRTLVTNADVGLQYGFVMGNGPFVRNNPALTATVVTTLTATAKRVLGQQAELATILAGATGISQDIWARALARDPFEIQPMNDELVRGQQKVADRFRAQGLVPIDINVADAVWHPSA